jgi:hypothetical protein
MTQMTPADELRAAAFLLRNPLHGLKTPVDTDLAELLATWLTESAQMETYTLAEFGHRGGGGTHALAVARLINREAQP